MNSRWKITWLEQTISTNTFLLEKARGGCPDRSAVIAQEQTGGRGRRGRSFLSPAGGLYMSILLRRLPYDDCTVMTAVAAVAFCRALIRLSGAAVDIKWVNDLLIDGKKVAGILAEGVISPDNRLEGVVIGVGVNLTQPPQPVADIACTLPGEITPESAARTMLDELDEAMSRPLEDVMEEYRQRSAAIGRWVRVISSTGEYEALVLDTDPRARLICLTESGERLVLESGEISIRL